MQCNILNKTNPQTTRHWSTDWAQNMSFRRCHGQLVTYVGTEDTKPTITKPEMHQLNLRMSWHKISIKT